LIALDGALNHHLQNNVSHAESKLAYGLMAAADKPMELSL
jgi:hypothetical protein